MKKIMVPAWLEQSCGFGSNSEIEVMTQTETEAVVERAIREAMRRGLAATSVQALDRSGPEPVTDTWQSYERRTHWKLWDRISDRYGPHFSPQQGPRRGLTKGARAASMELWPC